MHLRLFKQNIRNSYIPLPSIIMETDSPHVDPIKPSRSGIDNQTEKIGHSRKNFQHIQDPFGKSNGLILYLGM